MSLFEWATIVISIVSIVSIVLSIIAYLKSTKVGYAQLELSTSQNITNTKERVSDISMQMSSLASISERSDEQQRQFDVYSKTFQSAVENNVNAYEVACSHYLDKKVDRARFKKTYQIEIRQLVENENFRKTYFDPTTSRYKAILKVYRMWEDQER